MDAGGARSGDVDRDVAIELRHRALDRIEARPHRRHALRRRSPPDRAGAGEMVIHLAAHRGRLPDHRLAQIAAIGGRFVHDHGERRLERMGEVAGVGTRFLRLALIMREQLVQLLHHRRDLDRQAFVDPRDPARPHRRDRTPHLAQRPQPERRLEGRHHDQAEAQDREGAHQRPSQDGDLLVEAAAILRHLEAPDDRRSGQARIALHHAQRLVLELVAVIDVGALVAVIAARLERPIPQRTRAEGEMARAGHLIIEARSGLEETLVAQRPVEADLADGVDLGRGDHRAQHILQLGVEVTRDRHVEHAIECEAAADQQDRDPQGGDTDHPPGERAGGLARDARRLAGLARNHQRAAEHQAENVGRHLQPTPARRRGAGALLVRRGQAGSSRL